MLLVTALAQAGCPAAPAKVPLGPLQPRPSGARLRVVDAGGDAGDTGLWPHVRLDAQERAHLAFCDVRQGDVRYAWEAADGLHVASVVHRGAVGKYLAMDLDRRGCPGISYYNQDTMHLRYARLRAGAAPDAADAWEDEPVAWGREAGMGSALAFDAADRPHLFYYLASGKLVHAVRRDEGWGKEAVEVAHGVYSARMSAQARADGVWASYVDWQMRDPALYIGHIDGAGAWHRTQAVAQGGPGWQSQLLFAGDAQQVVHTHRLTKQVARSRPRPAAADAPWETEVLAGCGSSFAAGLWRGRLVLAYQDATDLAAGGRLRLAVEPADPAAPWPRWRLDDAAPVGRAIDLAVGAHGRLLIAYYTEGTRSLALYDARLP